MLGACPTETRLSSGWQQVFDLLIRKHKSRRVIVTLCIGDGQGIALALEML